MTKLGKKPESNDNEAPEDTPAEETTEKKDTDASELFPNGEQEKNEDSEGTIFDSFAQTLQSRMSHYEQPFLHEKSFLRAKPRHPKMSSSSQKNIILKKD